MTLLFILLATLTAGIGSVWVAAALSYGVLRRYTQHMLSLAAGALLATAFLHLLPEALESEVGTRELFIALLGGLVFFFLLDKAELWHHGHEHHQGHDDDDHDHEHGGVTPGAAAGTGGVWALLAGDSLHAFGDGVLIAAAFVADHRLGLITALSVLAHEVPHHMGDLAVVQGDSRSGRRAVLKVSLAGAVTALGGVVGYALVDAWQDLQSYFLALTSSSFIYVALADLIPQLQKRLSAGQTAVQVAWLGAGIGLVTLVSGMAHGH